MLQRSTTARAMNWNKNKGEATTCCHNTNNAYVYFKTDS